VTIANDLAVNSAGFTMLSGVIGNNFQLTTAGAFNLYSGRIGDSFVANVDSFNLYGGSIGRFFNAEGVINILGGNFDNGLHAYGTLNLYSGSIGLFGTAHDGSTINVTGGSLANSFVANLGSTINVSGGSIGNDFDAHAASAVNLFGTQIVLDGVDVTSLLTEGVPWTISDRDVMLTGTLVDGSSFEFGLFSVDLDNRDYFAADADLTFTLITTIPGDYNGDDVVSAADYTVWRNALGTAVATRGTGGDGNFDGQVTMADYHIWKRNFGKTLGGPGAGGVAGEVAVPEPASATICLLAAIGFIAARRRAQCGTLIAQIPRSRGGRTI
jgi:hypothetical protein